jgi:predicted nucleic acid-binding protein
MKRILLDTNVYIDFLNSGQHEALVLGAGLVRHMSAVVLMELEAGATTPAARRTVSQLARAFEKFGRLHAPPGSAWPQAGGILRRLRSSGREVRRASLVNDVLIALTAREIGATLVTGDVSDFGAIRRILASSVEEPALP